MNLLFLCIMAYVEFFEEKCFVCFLFLCRKKKKELVVYCNDQIFSVVVFFYLSFDSEKGFQ